MNQFLLNTIDILQSFPIRDTDRSILEEIKMKIESNEFDDIERENYTEFLLDFQRRIEAALSLVKLSDIVMEE